jgi:hypothetical protein
MGNAVGVPTCLEQVKPMTIFSFPAIYRDRFGEEQTTLYREGPAFRMTVRGVKFSSLYDFCTFETELPPASSELSSFTLNQSGELRAFTLIFQMPVPVVINGTEQQGRLVFDLVYADVTTLVGSLQLTLTLDSETLTVKGEDDWTESGLAKIQSILAKDAFLKCCFTCAFSDYNPAGGPLACFRNNKTAYFSMERSKPAIFAIWNTRTEQVHETYLCPEFERRQPGTGWRG